MFSVASSYDQAAFVKTVNCSRAQIVSQFNIFHFVILLEFVELSSWSCADFLQWTLISQTWRVNPIREQFPKEVTVLVNMHLVSWIFRPQYSQ